MSRALAEAGHQTEIVPIRTAGDEAGATGGGAPRAPAPPGDKSRFVKEIEDALFDGSVDLAVHSAKDVPGRLPEGLELVATPAAEDARDALAGCDTGLEGLPDGARVGTSSLRRRSQLLALRPDLEIVPLRGNVDTRLRKLEEEALDAAVLALAGLRRLGREDGAHALEPTVLVPAPGQGVLALEARADDQAAGDAARSISDPASGARLAAERAVVVELDASCRTPVGACASIDGDMVRLMGYAGLPDGTEWIRDEVRGTAREAAEAGRELARRMLAAGAGDLLQRAEEAA